MNEPISHMVKRLWVFSRVATKSNSAYNMMNVVWASTFSFLHNILRMKCLGSKWNLIHTCLVMRGGSLLILRIVRQRSRSQLLKIEHIFDTFLVSSRYIKNKKLSTHMPHAERNKSHELEVCGSKVKITISKDK